MTKRREFRRKAQKGTEGNSAAGRQERQQALGLQRRLPAIDGGGVGADAGDEFGMGHEDGAADHDADVVVERGAADRTDAVAQRIDPVSDPTESPDDREPLVATSRTRS